MTVGEASRVIKAYNENRRDRAYFAYTEAMALGAFVASVFSSKSPPSVNDIYPELFPKEEQEAAETDARMERSVANFLKFANAFNRRYTDGNRKFESENNG